MLLPSQNFPSWLLTKCESGICSVLLSYLNLTSTRAFITLHFHRLFTELVVGQHALVESCPSDRVDLCAGESGPCDHRSLHGSRHHGTSVSPTKHSPYPNHGALYLAHMGHLINVYRSEFNWNLPTVTQQAVTEWVCPPSLGCSGNNLWRIHPIPINGTSMRTGREVEKSNVWESTTGFMMSTTDGSQGEAQGPCSFTDCQSWEGPLRFDLSVLGGWKLRPRLAVPGPRRLRQLQVQPLLHPLHPSSQEGWLLSFFKFKGKNHSRRVPVSRLEIKNRPLSSWKPFLWPGASLLHLGARQIYQTELKMTLQDVHKESADGLSQDTFTS